MKTAMQELIDWTIDEQFPVNKQFTDKVFELLEKEKEQMCEFAEWYSSGLTNTERWRKPIDEHYKYFLIINRKPNL